MQRFSIREVVEMALQTERTGYLFYTSMMQKFSAHKGLNELFQLLAEQEAAHEKLFEKLLEKITDEEPYGWDEAQPYIRAMVESEFFLGRGKSLPDLDHVREVSDAVDFAIGFEKETMLYFIGFKNAVNQKDIVEQIIQEETRHISWLMNFREKLAP